MTAAHQMNHFGIKVRYIYKLNKNANPRARNLWTSKAGFGQVKIMKEFVWINIIFFLNLAFGQLGEKNSGKVYNNIDKNYTFWSGRFGRTQHVSPENFIVMCFCQIVIEIIVSTEKGCVQPKHPKQTKVSFYIYIIYYKSLKCVVQQMCNKNTLKTTG